MTENWKPIPGYEGYYEASNLGRIRSAERLITDSSGKRTRHYKSRILTPQLRANYNKEKYWINLTVNGKAHSHILARLIARTWCDGYEEGLTVDHIDGNCLNNKATNLEWVTWKENLDRGYRNGLMRQIAVTLEDEDGNRHDFVSRTEASRWLGRCPQYLTAMLDEKCNITSADGNKYTVIKGAEKQYA